MTNQETMTLTDNVLDTIERIGAKAPFTAHARRPYSWAVRMFRSPKELTLKGASARFVMENAEDVGYGFGGERDRIADVLDVIRPDDVFYDIGANIGLYTCLVGDALDDGEVYAFEPAPRTARKLEKNITLNGTRAQAVNLALSDSSGTLQFAVDKRGTGRGNAIVTDESEVDREEMEIIDVPVKTGDTYIRDSSAPKPDVVKIDVEGAEYNTLRGLQETLPDVRHVFCEVHPGTIQRFGGSLDELIELLESEGFAVDTDRRSYVHAYREDGER